MQKSRKKNPKFLVAPCANYRRIWRACGVSGRFDGLGVCLLRNSAAWGLTAFQKEQRNVTHVSTLAVIHEGGHSSRI